MSKTYRFHLSQQSSCLSQRRLQFLSPRQCILSWPRAFEPLFRTRTTGRTLRLLVDVGHGGTCGELSRSSNSMRNLSLCAKTTSSLPNTRITAAAVDLDRDVLYVASEQHNPDNGEVAFEIWKIALSGSEDVSHLSSHSYTYSNDYDWEFSPPC